MAAWESQHSHTHLCSVFSSFIFAPCISCAPSLTLAQSWMASPPTTHTHSRAQTHTHTSSPSVYAAARVSCTGSSWEQDRESVSWLFSSESNFRSSLSCCAVVYQTVSQHHAVCWWALRAFVTPVCFYCNESSSQLRPEPRFRMNVKAQQKEKQTSLISLFIISFILIAQMAGLRPPRNIFGKRNRGTGMFPVTECKRNAHILDIVCCYYLC